MTETARIGRRPLQLLYSGKAATFGARLTNPLRIGRRRAMNKVGPPGGPSIESSSEIPFLQPDAHRHYNSLANSELRGIFAWTGMRSAMAGSMAH
jgi:hypothetical protein